MQNKSILLIIGGGISAYKTLDLIRRIRERGSRVRAVLTEAAQQFVTPLSVAALTEERAYTNIFDLKDETEMGHIRLSREADVIVVAPATADLLARMTAGMANDLAAAVLLAADKPIIAAPAMNWRMWEHPATQDNVARLKARGVRFVGPGEGAMACGEFGSGRMAEPTDILLTIEQVVSGLNPNLLSGLHVIITAGPTHEPIDPVRYLANRSSGKQGYAIAAAAVRFGARVTLVSGPVNLPSPNGVHLTAVQTAQEMLAAVESAMPADIAIFAAAVADWRPEQVAANKLKKNHTDNKPPVIHLTENPDIARTIGLRRERRPRLIIGFAAETQNLIENAQKKLTSKGCDWIAANDVSPAGGVMGGERNQISLISSSNIEVWPEMSKEQAAERLIRKIAECVQR